ncbi:MAG: GtrA family protein [Ginsengibacter sp.]
MRQKIIRLIDFFYPPFKRFMPLQTFRYAVCGSGNVLLDLFIYFISYNFILDKQNLAIGFLVFKPHIAALLMAFCVSFPVGFLLAKYIVFNSSQLHGRVQLFRYMLIVVINLVLNYTILKVLVEYMGFYPTIAKVFATAFIVTFSYLSQKHFSFKMADSIGGLEDTNS